MKRSVKLFSLLLSAVLLFSLTVSPVVAAYGMTEDQWEEYWDSFTADGSAIHLAPGSDETMMNVSWFGEDSAVIPQVYVRMLGTEEFSLYEGRADVTENANVNYKVTLKNLSADTVYEYYCVSGDYCSQTYKFKTSAVESFSAVLVSDIHISENNVDAGGVKGTAYHTAEIFAEACQKNPEVSLLLSSGDNADTGRLSEYMGLFANPLVQSIPLATVCGNHDYKKNVYPDVVNYPNAFNSQAISPDKDGGDYWFVKGDVLFLMMNSNWISADDHHTFVENAVKANPDVKWRVVVMHHDLYGGHIPHRESDNELYRKIFTPIFDEFNVDLVLMGHSHVYSRSHVVCDGKVVENLTGDSSVTDAQGTIYITTGSISKPRDTDNHGSSKVAFDYKSPTDYIYDIIEFSEDSITFTAYVADKDEAIDNFTIYKTSEGNTVGNGTGANDFVYFIATFAAFFRGLWQYIENLF